jgi:hypothetical protein
VSISKNPLNQFYVICWIGDSMIEKEQQAIIHKKRKCGILWYFLHTLSLKFQLYSPLLVIGSFYANLTRSCCQKPKIRWIILIYFPFKVLFWKNPEKWLFLKKYMEKGTYFKFTTSFLVTNKLKTHQNERRWT